MPSFDAETLKLLGSLTATAILAVVCIVEFRVIIVLWRRANSRDEKLVALYEKTNEDNDKRRELIGSQIKVVDGMVGAIRDLEREVSGLRNDAFLRGSHVAR